MYTIRSIYARNSSIAVIDRSTLCRDSFMDNFAYANRTVSMLLGCEQVPLMLPVHVAFLGAEHTVFSTVLQVHVLLHT